MASFPWGVVGHAHYNDYRWSFVGRPVVVCLFVVIVVIPLLSQLVSFALS